MKQLINVFTLAPGAKLEVVCHGQGISMLVKAKSFVQENIAQMKMKGVEFVACEFTMKYRNITKDETVPAAGFVKGGIIEIVTRLVEGWSYIKSGF